jgi:hypothetical protein
MAGGFRCSVIKGRSFDLTHDQHFDRSSCFCELQAKLMGQIKRGFRFAILGPSLHVDVPIGTR